MTKTFFILDPGHGIDIKGKRSPEIPPGFAEWEFVREIADMIRLGCDTKKVEVFDVLRYFSDESRPKAMRLRDRTWFANQIAHKYEGSPVFFVSLHTNAAGNNGWYDDRRGSCFFVAQKSGHPSTTLGKEICQNLEECGIKNNGKKVRDFYVLKHTICPAILVEILFHTSRLDCLIAESKKIEIAGAFIRAFESFA